MNLKTILCLHLAIIAAIPGLALPALADPVEPSALAPTDIFPPEAPAGLNFTMSVLDEGSTKPRDLRSCDVKLEGDKLTVSKEGYSVGFLVEPRGSYVAIRIKTVEEPRPGSLQNLECVTGPRRKYQMIPLDYMTRTRAGSQIAQWSMLPDRDGINPMGAVAIQSATSDEEFDENLLRIWVNEGLPHPAVGEWTLDRARSWLADWQKHFADQSSLAISASTPDELERATEWAEKIGAKRIYLHTDTWRGEYWPKEASHMNVKRGAFPAGEEDLRKYGQRLNEKGMALALHTTSMSIALKDPDYVANGVHPELARWTRGTLERDVTAKDQKMFFRPGPPPRGATWSKYLATIPSFFGRRSFLIDGELIDVGNIANMDGEVWELQACRRGDGSTKPADHKAGTPVEGMVRGYGQAFVPDTESPLFEEVITRWADFCNANNVNHHECDALEIHRFKPWGMDKFSWIFASKLKEHSTSNTSGGGPLPWHIEYWFRSSKNVMNNHAIGGMAGGASLPLYAESNFRPATGPYEILLKPQQKVMAGGQSFYVSKPIKMFGVTAQTIEKTGISREIEKMIANWRAIIPDMTPEARKKIQETHGPFRSPLGEAKGHPASDVLFRPEVDGATRRIVPLRMVGRPGGEINWGYGQECGPIVPRQYVRAEGSLELDNPWAAQEPEFVVRVLGTPTEAGKAAPESKPEGKTDESKAIEESYEKGILTNDNSQPNSEPPPAAPVAETDLMPHRVSLIQGTKNSLSADGEWLAVSCSNTAPAPDAVPATASSANATDMPAYFQPTEFASWPVSRNLVGATGLACEVEGDGSGALLVITLCSTGERDYVIPIDFTGTRQIEIPNGDAAIADPRWGWRFATRGFDYAGIRLVKVGFGMVPPNTEAKAKIRNLRPLRLAQKDVSNLTLKVGDQGEFVVPGPVPSGHYLWYLGGDTIGLYDANWNKVSDLPVQKQNFLFPQGRFPLDISTGDEAPKPWLECQFFVKGEPIEITAK